MATQKKPKTKQQQIADIKKKLTKDVDGMNETVDILNGKKPITDKGKLNGIKIKQKGKDKSSQTFEEFIENVETGWNKYPGQPKNPYGNDASQRPKIKIIEKGK